MEEEKKNGTNPGGQQQRDNNNTNKTHIKYSTPALKKTKELEQTIQSAPDAIPDYVVVDTDAEWEYWIHE